MRGALATKTDSFRSFVMDIMVQQLLQGTLKTVSSWDSKTNRTNWNRFLTYESLTFPDTMVAHRSKVPPLGNRKPTVFIFKFYYSSNQWLPEINIFTVSFTKPDGQKNHQTKTKSIFTSRCSIILNSQARNADFQLGISLKARTNGPLDGHQTN